MTETAVRDVGIPLDDSVHPVATAVRVSVIIPCHDCTDTIGEQLESLSRQQLDEPWEVILVDNDSRDDLAKVVAPFRLRLPALRLIRATEQKNAGYARNEGARVARGDLLLFTDADDVVAERWLPEMVRALERHDFVASRLEHEFLNSQRVLRSRRTKQTDDLIQYRDPHFLPHASGSTLGVRREVHERVEGFRDLKNLQDTDYCWRVQLAGHELNFARDAAVHYRYRAKASSNFLQAFHYGLHNVLLYALYRPHGMPRAGWRRGVRKWWRLMISLPDLLHPDSRLRWLRGFGFQLGRLTGCVRHRVLAP